MNAVDTNVLLYAHDPHSEDYDAYAAIDGMELRNPFARNP